MQKQVYGKEFMQYTAGTSAYAAQVITGLLKQRLHIGSVLDVGCAHGTWVRAWIQAGIEDAVGVDGDYVDKNRIEITPDRFVSWDLNQAFDLGRNFDLVQSLEVGEHIRPSSAEAFVDSISRHARTFVLYSAAPPGQGGEYHINERPYEFWRSLFYSRGLVALDWLRPRIIADTRISYWYRYNTLLYVRREALGGLPEEFRSTALDLGMPVPDISPPMFRLRKALVRQLPFALQHQVARAKARLFPTGRF